ncbi:MAG: aspartate carbamoyltransferase regulatory subunit [Candidatus Kapaibacterium sp.]|jgi:aspartate carbamoyltransferase regulatory subunit|nr:aspartate carbamoyltransferase regulatory subunit [Candidatus Kapabacteria bacterium]
MTVKELKVTAIENGTVIDHIPSKNVFQVIRILNLENFDNQILFGTNLESKKYGTKGIIKVKNKFFESKEINKIALVAPKATLIIIKDFKVVEKKTVEIPDHIDEIVKCFNPNCITNVEKVKTKFDVVSKEEVILRCHFCEKNTVKNNITFR